MEEYNDLQDEYKANEEKNQGDDDYMVRTSPYILEFLTIFNFGNKCITVSLFDVIIAS